MARRVAVKGGEIQMKLVITGLSNILKFFEEPLWLLSLLLVIPLKALGKESSSRLQVRQKSDISSNKPEVASKTGNRKPPATLRRLTRLRMTAVILTILALAGTSLPLPTNRQHLSVLIDVSDSITQAEREKARAAVLEVLAQMQPVDRIDLIIFAGSPRVLGQGLTPTEAEGILETVRLFSSDAQYTNLESSLLTADQLFQNARGNKAILLLSDGRPNAGETAIHDWAGSFYTTTRRRNRGRVPIHTIALGKTGNNLISLALHCPATVRAGENTLLKWEVYAEHEQKVTVNLRVNGKEYSAKELNLTQGRQELPLTMRAPEFGVHQVEIEVSDARKILIPHATCGGILRVQGQARVLVVKEGKKSSPLTETLKVQGMEVQESGVQTIPESLSGLAAYSGVVLDNVPALYLTKAQEDALAGFVAGGGGLLVVGGDSSLGRGEYYASGLEDLLPVQTDTRQRLLFTRAKILYLLDQSGSMGELVGEISKEKVALQGIKESLQELDSLDEVGILAFSNQAEWILPFTAAVNFEVIEAALARSVYGGGTDIASGLIKAVQGLRGTGPLRRHLVILTDGRTISRDLEELCRQLQGMGVTITTIGIGKNVNNEILESIARWGEGQYYQAEANQIPQIIRKETIRVSRDLIQEGSFTPVLRRKADFLDGLEKFPQVYGYLITKPKSMSTVYLEIGAKNDPLLVGWRYGNGQVAVFTSDSGSRWLAPWAHSGLYNQFWGQITRSIMKGRNDTGLHLTTRNDGGAVRLLVDATGPDRRLRTGLYLIGRMSGAGQEVFKLKETLPGRYEALLPTSGRGMQEFEIAEWPGESWTVGAVWLPPSDEFQSYGPDLTVLSYLSSLTGGKALSITEPKIPSSWSWEPFPLRQWLIIIVLVLFGLELVDRSLSLGQAAMAKTVLGAWWTRQQEILRSLHASARTDDAADISGEKTKTAYRYLAEKKKVRRGLWD